MQMIHCPTSAQWVMCYIPILYMKTYSLRLRPACNGVTIRPDIHQGIQVGLVMSEFHGSDVHICCRQRGEVRNFCSTSKLSMLNRIPAGAFTPAAADP